MEIHWIGKEVLVLHFITGKERMLLLGLQNTVDATDVFVVVTICFG